MTTLLEPSAFFSATKALRYCRDTPRPFGTPPYNNSLALVNAIESQQTLLEYADFRGAVAECLPGRAAASAYDAAAALPRAPALAAFSAALKAFKLPEDFAAAWKGGLEPSWDAWLRAVAAHVAGLEAVLLRVQASGKDLAALNARLRAARARMDEEHAASLVTKLDARTLRKRAKAAERERALREAQEEAEGATAAGRKSAKKALKKMGAGGGGGGGGEGEGEGEGEGGGAAAAAPAPLPAAAKQQPKKAPKGASLPPKPAPATGTISSPVQVPGA